MSFLSRIVTRNSLVFRNQLYLSSIASPSFCKSSSSLAGKMAPKLCEQIVSSHDIVKSESDRNDYRGLVLNNGLRVLVVSDPTTDKSAAALSVAVGSLSDPRHLPGLAHFCEHMLFLGTKKYPSENQYSTFISAHSGMTNAYTALDHTCYYFDVTPEHFREACDIFAQFFLEPLFDQSSTDRELKAIDSEHDKNIKQDMWRLYRLEGVTGNPEHDFSKFGTGNRQTLEVIPKKNNVDVRQALLDFHSKYYSSNIMNVCLIGKENLDDLSDMAVEMFAGVQNKNVKAPEWPDHPFTEKEVKILAKVVPVKDLRQIVISFPVPDWRAEYKGNPGNYVSHLVAHEGEHSLLSYLKAKGWANTLVGGLRAGARGFGFFSINMNLSPEGLEHIDEIVTAVFQYLDILRKQGPQKWVFDELQDLGKMHFRFKQKETPFNEVTILTDAMAHYGWEDLLSAAYVVEEYRPDLINELMTHLVPEKVRIAVVSEKFKGQTDKVEEYYSTEYSVESIPDEKIQRWKNVSPNEYFKMRTPNEFIPTNFSLAPAEPKYHGTPKLVIDDQSTRIWFLQDSEFKLPHNIVTFDLRTPKTYSTPLNVSLITMAVSCFRDANNEYFYPADLAGLSYSVSNGTGGMTIKINGYNEKQYAMLEKVCERLVNFTIDPKRFEILKESYVRQLKNFKAEQPYQHCGHYTRMVLSEKYWSNEEVLEQTEKECTVERCEQILKEVIGKHHIEGLILGNMTSDEAQRIGQTIRRIFKSESLTAEETPNGRECLMNEKNIYQLDRINEVHPTNAVVTVYQCGIFDISNLRQIALNDLFCQVIDEPCFNTLRTKEQLGYIVKAYKRRTINSYGVSVLVQSEKNPSYLSDRIDAFMNESTKTALEQLTVEELETHKNALIALKLEKPKKLCERYNLTWSEIASRSYVFDRLEQEAATIKTLSKQELLDFYNRHIARDASSLRQLVINVESKIKPGEKGPGIKPTQIITDVEEFKKKHPMIDVLKPQAKL